MWLLSFLLGTYFGDSKKNTGGGRVNRQFDEGEAASAINEMVFRRKQQAGECMVDLGRQEIRPTEETARWKSLPMSESLWLLMISPSSK